MPESLPGYDDWKTENSEEEEERMGRRLTRRQWLEDMAEEKEDRERDERQG